MDRAFPIAFLLVSLCGVALSQSTPASPVFEIADVHASAPATNAFMRGGFVSGGRYEIHTASMVDLISAAWGIEPDSVFGGPSWLDTDRFEIIAKAAANSTEVDRQLMLRALLADRFGLVVHDDKKPLDVFTLTAGKRVLMKEAEGIGEFECKQAPFEGKTPPPYITLTCRNVTMPEFAKQFRQMAGGYVTHQMVDLTGLKGSYDFTIRWTGRGQLNRPAPANGEPDPNPGISFFEAVEKQLGLKLAPEKRPMPAIVVDSVNRTPTPNAPGVSKAIPNVPTEFEAASVKPSKPGSDIRRIQAKPGGRIEVENIPLRQLIGLAWDVDQDDNMIVGGPKWIESESFDIVAKTADFPGSAPPPFDTVRIMLRALLIERFKLTVHNENQPVTVYGLVVGKRGPRLKDADPASRSGCKRGTGESGSGSASVPMITYTCLNTTMAQLSDAMHSIAPAYVDHPAVDMTSLKGAYDFTITWTPKGAIMGGGGRGAEPGQSASSDPTGGTTFFEAVDKQLGLRLEGGHKHPVPVLVIDHVEHLVADN